MTEAYFIHLAIITGIYLVLALSLQLSLGYSGLLNLGHIAFFGIGAYVSALLSLRGMPFTAAFIAAGVAAGVFGWLLSIPTGRLKGDYLALTTLGFSFVAYAVFLNWTEVTSGPFGLPGIPKPALLGMGFSGGPPFLALTAAIALFSYFFIRRICHSRFGKALEAVRDDELAAASLGKNTLKLKSVSLAASAFFAGIAGSLFAAYITFIDPSSFTFMNLLPVLLIVIVGGLASLRGTILATVIIILLPEPLRFISLPSSVIGPARQIIYAAVLLATIYFKPRGFFGRVDLE